MVTRVLTLGAAVCALFAAGRRHRANATMYAQPEPRRGHWSVINSPYGPGTWLTQRGAAEVAHAFVPPGARASHDESDHDRQRWRHLTVDSDTPWRQTVTVLDMHEVQTMVPTAWSGWVLVQSVRYADGTVGAAHLLASIEAVGVESAVLDGALRILGGTEKLRAKHLWGAARTVCNVAAHMAAAEGQPPTSTIIDVLLVPAA